MADNSTSAASARTGGEKAAPQEPGQQQPPLATEEFHREKHIKFFQRCLMMLPSEAQSLDTSRTTLVYFCVAGLDLLNALEPLIAKDKINPAALIDWIYAMQVRPDPSAADPTAGLGFRGAPHLGQPYLPAEGGACRCCKPDTGSLAHTYTAILTLAILGDDFGRLERAAIVKTLHSYQLPDGSFVSHPDGGEADMRYVYCACCIAYMLDDWGSIDRDAVVRFVRNSLCYDAGIAQAPDLESHAGSTLCALASLQLMGRLDDALSPVERARLVQWLITRQEMGFSGRPHKAMDTCYSYWVGASLTILNAYQYVDVPQLRQYVMSTQDKLIGGLAKWPLYRSDPLHSYLGIAGLSLAGEDGIEPLDHVLNLSARSSAKLRERLRARKQAVEP